VQIVLCVEQRGESLIFERRLYFVFVSSLTKKCDKNKCAYICLRTI